eukprot:CAMPEP_0117825074 /NCGR_PEP_ID=MMETSP0949-20121206/5273_1 /TAXON_ID=44440 /ORGANISM="Chattonella subsalsa, Strain CCMP2191" /LENGTH=70 /DNA_ID=CAMNT_0005665003 /DNA_START=194 /DNA_END=406 /DNA_ORIENTATION=+
MNTLNTQKKKTTKTSLLMSGQKQNQENVGQSSRSNSSALVFSSKVLEALVMIISVPESKTSKIDLSKSSK